MKRPSKYQLKFRGKDITTVYPSGIDPYIVKNAAEFYDSRKLFNYSYTDFTDLFSYSRGQTLSMNERILSSENLLVTSYLNEVSNALDKIRKLSNLDNALTLDQSRDFLSEFKLIFNLLEKEFSWTKSDYFLVPLKGGGVITELYDQIPLEKVVKVDCKRVPLIDEEGKYGFGMHIPQQISASNVSEADEFIDSRFNNKKITILELCVASGITTLGFLIDLIHRNIRPKEIVILSTAIAQQGYEISTNFANEHGIDLKFITSKVVYSLKDHYRFAYDPLTYDSGDLVVKSPYDAFNMVYNSSNLK